MTKNCLRYLRNALVKTGIEAKQTFISAKVSMRHITLTTFFSLKINEIQPRFGCGHATRVSLTFHQKKEREKKCELQIRR